MCWLGVRWAAIDSVVVAVVLILVDSSFVRYAGGVYDLGGLHWSADVSFAEG